MRLLSRRSVLNWVNPAKAAISLILLYLKSSRSNFDKENKGEMSSILLSDKSRSSKFAIPARGNILSILLCANRNSSSLKRGDKPSSDWILLLSKDKFL